MILLTLAFFVASRTTGSGWLVVLVALSLGVIAVGILGPIFSLRTVAVDVEAPTDALAGRPFDIRFRVETRSRVHVTSVEPVGTTVSASGGTGDLRVIAARRGLLHEVAIEVRSGAPFGLAWATRRIELALPHPIEVAPRVTPARLPAAVSVARPGEEHRGSRQGQGETVRTVREYSVGDPIRLMHWPATARSDQPIVKELESPDAPLLTVRVDLNTNADEAERRASVAAGLVQAGLAAGRPVALHTAEAGGPHAGFVGSMLEAGRRLARATHGPLPASTESAGTTIVAGVS